MRKILEKNSQNIDLNFDEVEKGFTKQEAIDESKRCLNCKHKPCVSGCPVKIEIPEFIKEILNGDISSSYKIITKYNLLPAICGRVCPQEKQCQMRCVRGKNGRPVSIGKLERYVADNYNEEMRKENEKVKFLGMKVAVVGSGPSGLVCAGGLSKLGFAVTIYEALHKVGGVLTYGIPKFRLPQEILESEIEKIKRLGVNIVTNVVIGRTLSIDDLFKNGYRAVYIACGAGLPKFMGIAGEKLPGVCCANEFLTRINLMYANIDGYDTPMPEVKNIVVIGGGNVAMDAARCARRLKNSNVTVLYRRKEEDMPARKEEVLHAKNEGVNFIFSGTPTKIVGDKKVEGIEYVDNSFPVSGSNVSRSKFLKCDFIIVAIGNKPNTIIKNTTDEIKCDLAGRIVVNNVENDFRTSKKYVYAGGDIVTGAATVILAMSAGKKAAQQIYNDLIVCGDA